MDVKKSLYKLIIKGSARSVKAKKNILISLLIRGGGVLVAVIMIPVSLDYLNPEKFGIWLTLYSIMGWLSFFDVGLGNGLRNKLAKAISEDNEKLARTYVSTTYAILFIISTSIFCVFFIINKYLDWSAILNANQQLVTELNLLALIVFTFFLLKLVLKLVGIVYVADQMPSVSNGFDFLGNILALLGVIAISQFSQGSLLYLGTVISVSPILVLGTATLFTYTKTYRSYRPSLKYVDFNFAGELAGLGFRFFLLQIGAVVLFTTDNIIIAQIIGPEEVTDYNIAYKYFSVLIIVFSTIAGTYWSAYTEAYHNEELKWIKSTINSQLKLWIGLVILCIVMILVAHPVFRIWVGEEISISNSLIIAIAIFVIIQSLNSTYVNFINGVGKLRLQIFTALVAIVLNIPLSIYLAKYLSFGSTGVVMSTIFIVGISSLIMMTQYQKIVEGKATGIWDK